MILVPEINPKLAALLRRKIANQCSWIRGLPVLWRGGQGFRSGTNLITRLLFCGIMIAIAPSINGQVSSDGIWRIADPSVRRANAKHSQSILTTQQIYTVDKDKLINSLARAPIENSPTTRSILPVITMPMPSGEYSSFEFVESPVMPPDLAAKFPEIKTYLGHAVGAPATSIRCELSANGFQAQITGPSGVVHITPYTDAGRDICISYYKRNRPVDMSNFECLTESTSRRSRQRARESIGASRSGELLRTYSLACAATGEYTAFHGGAQSAMAAIATTVNRINGIFERELAIRFILVSNNDSIIYENSTTDPYTNGDTSALVVENQINLDNVIGDSNYDIGHVFGTGPGGLARLGSVCRSESKGRAATGLSNPIGDPFDVDFVAHEFGHQFGAHHTWTGINNRCSDVAQFDLETAVEPGSGSTIMSYGGLCGSDNIQSAKDPFFHTVSLDEMNEYITNQDGGLCPATVATGNSIPAVNAGSDFMIPKLTPFTLTGSGSDSDSSDLTFVWEPMDTGPRQAISAVDNGSTPLFRSSPPGPIPVRTFPTLTDILNNSVTPGEKLPSIGRTMSFRLSVRDNHSGGGAINSDDMQVIVNSASGPFSITFPNENLTLSGIQTVTWSVANTDQAPVNAANVNILLSTDGGNTFSTILAANTPNDGSESVRLPDISSGTVRIKIEAVGNIFFDISDSNFSIPLCAVMPFMEDFEGGTTLADYWQISGTNAHRTQVTSSNGPRGSFHLTMDDMIADSIGSRNELTLCINLAGYKNVQLSFWLKEFNDEDHGPPTAPFVGGADFDGVAVSADGANWYEIENLRESDKLRADYTRFIVDLDAAILARNLIFTSTFFIRFNHFDENPISTDGFAFDDIEITGDKHISGTVTYRGSQTGAIYLTAFDDGVFSGNPRFQSVIIDSLNVSGVEAYDVISSLPDGIYSYRVFMDVDSSGGFNGGDPVDQVTHINSSFPPVGNDINFVLSDWDHDFVLNQGWNLISFPGIPLSGNISQLMNYITGAIWTWDGSSMVTRNSNSVSGRKGYWLYLIQPDSVFMRGILDTPGTMLSTEWNLVGVADNITDLNILSNIQFPIWKWDLGQFIPVVDNGGLDRFTGYWIFANDVTSIP